jgi:hypothetical protein
MATQKVLVLDSTTNFPKELTPNTTSAGAADAGKVVALNSAGVLDSTLFPAGIGQASLTMLASEALAAGAAVNIFSNSGTPNVRNANATDATKPAIGFVNAAVSSGGTATIYFDGQLLSGLSGLTVGAPVYLGTTAGQITSTAPSASGNLVQQCGYAVSTTEIIFSQQVVAIHG